MDSVNDDEEMTKSEFIDWLVARASTMIGRRVADRRQQMRVRQTTIADTYRLQAQLIANLEADRGQPPSLRVLYSIADALGVEARDLLPTMEELTNMPRVEVRIGDIISRVSPETERKLWSLLIEEKDQ